MVCVKQNLNCLVFLFHHYLSCCTIIHLNDVQTTLRLIDALSIKRVIMLAYNSILIDIFDSRWFGIIIFQCNDMPKFTPFFVVSICIDRGSGNMKCIGEIKNIRTCFWHLFCIAIYF